MDLELENLDKSPKSELGLAIVQRLRAAIDYEIKHLYVNAQGKTGTFADFIKREANDALKIFKHSAKWSTLKALVERYAFVDLSARMSNMRQLINILDELDFIYSASESKDPLTGTLTSIDAKSFANDVAAYKKTEPKPVDPNLDISDLQVQFVHGVGPKLGAKLEQLNIASCEDLLHYLPRKHVSYEDKVLIKDLEPEDEVTIFGEVFKVAAFKATKRNMVIMTITIKDSTGKVKINKFLQGNSLHFYLKQYKSQFPEGAQVLCSGKVKADKYSKSIFQIQNPMLEIVSADFVEGEDNVHTGRIVPIYPLTEGLSLIQLRKLIYQTLKAYKSNLREFIPSDILEKYELMSYAEALEEIHFPSTSLAKDRATRRLIFNEFFMMQLRFMQRRYIVKHVSKGIKFNCFENGLVDKFLSTLEFNLTRAQERVFYSEILPDMVSEAPMHRLVQGDVGSGKTVVAFLALLVAIEDGYQGAIMAPTEILVEQHYRKFKEWVANIKGLNIFDLRVGFLTGRQRVKEKREVLEGLATGRINIVVGTHALIQDAVEFHNLGLIVIDEQHRFGVKQRDLLVRKGTKLEGQKDESLPLVEKLFMTATPIPRTLALSMHGDLDLSEIDEMPHGRLPIITQIAKRKSEVYRQISDEIAKGQQAYIVFPLIDESETLSAKAATVEYERLKQEVFPHCKIGLLHGKLSGEEKDTIMERFKAAEIDILVATTVVEVGVDVPNATVMLIESAERFGLAQLHQLRGRVGRGDKQSYCWLSSNSKSENNIIRMDILCKTNNGFIIAQEDMKLRGAGDFLGVQQSGIPDFAIANIADHEDLLIMARNAAKELITEDAELSNSSCVGLKSKMSKSKLANNFVGG